jgi:hypothetical protein
VSLRSIVFALALAFGLTPALPATAQSHFHIHYVRIPTASAVVLDRFELTTPPSTTGRLRDNLETCVAFHNTDPRTATAVRIESVYYNDAGTRKFSQLFTRTGTFGIGVEQGGSADPSAANCVRMKLPDAENIAVAYYVDSVDFADGSKWIAEGLTFPDQVIPGTVVPAPQIPKAPALAGTQLAPELLVRYPNCATAEAARINPNVAGTLVDVQPGAPIGDGLFHIGAVTLCQPSTNPALDAAALAAVRSLPEAIVREAAFRMFVPTMSYPATCQAPVRLLNMRLIEPQRELTEGGPAATGEYTALAHVDVRPDGYPGKITIVQSSKRAEFDDALRLSALATRYFPAIVNGAPALGGYDFPMSWVVELDDRSGRQRWRSFGPRYEPLPSSCTT